MHVVRKPGLPHRAYLSLDDVRQSVVWEVSSVAARRSVSVAVTFRG